MKRLAPLITAFLPSQFILAAGDGVNVVAEEVFKIGSLPVTNSMITSWVISLLLVVAVKLIVGQPKLVPTKGQLIVESVIGGIRGIIEPIVGKKVFSLLSGSLVDFSFSFLFKIGAVYYQELELAGYGYTADDHFVVKKPLIRPGNADLNMTLALALVANLFWIYFIVKFAGIKAIIKDWFGNKAEKSEVSSLIFGFLGIIFIAVGFIEVISILFRPVSLTFRLFGNVFGGESLLHSMFYLVPQLKWILPVPFYFMEVLIGLVQALVFMLLISVYIGLICNHEEGDHH